MEHVERFWSKVRKGRGCWLWLAYVHPSGYGRFKFRGELWYAHRVAFELERGPIPEGLTIDHLCRVRACVRPSHLEPVTNRENLLRGEGFTARQARRTRCIRGHPLAGENLRLVNRDNGRRERQCRKCMRLRDHAYRVRKRALPW